VDRKVKTYFVDDSKGQMTTTGVNEGRGGEACEMKRILSQKDMEATLGGNNQYDFSRGITHKKTRRGRIGQRFPGKIPEGGKTKEHFIFEQKRSKKFQG